MIVGMDVNWTAVLLYGVPSYIAALGAAAAAIISARNQRKLKTSNGTTVGQSVEKTHALATDNAATLDALAKAQGIETAPHTPEV